VEGEKKGLTVGEKKGEKHSFVPLVEKGSGGEGKSRENRKTSQCSTQEGEGSSQGSNGASKKLLEKPGKEVLAGKGSGAAPPAQGITSKVGAKTRPNIGMLRKKGEDGEVTKILAGGTSMPERLSKKNCLEEAAKRESVV